MIEIAFSPRLKELSTSLDDAWEAKMADQLPFPVAFHLKHLRQENYPWDFLLKDMLHILLKYLAIVAASDYLHSSNDPDFDINEQLQNLRLNMSEGHWLRLLRTCSASKRPLMINELNEIFNTTEMGPYYAKISWPETNIKTDNAGILSTLVTLRNKLLGHGKSPSENDKQLLTPQILGLFRSALYLYQPVWSYDLVYVFERKTMTRSLVLRGTTDFSEPDIQTGTFPSKCFLTKQGHVAVNLFPLVLSDKPKLASQVTLIDLQSEQYILDHIDNHYHPEYVGVGGASYKPANQYSALNHIFEEKKVWTKRQDVVLEDIFQKLKEKTLNNIEDIEYNNIYKTRSYFHRKDIEQFLNSFTEDQESRALIVSGVSGCGKTTSLLHFSNTLLEMGQHVLLIRAIELPERVQKPKEFKRWIVEYLGYNGIFAEVLEYVKTAGTGKLVIIIDGLNEFTAVGRDASKLFNNINHFLANYQQSGGLKVMVTIRSDTLPFFLPGGKLPVDALEELYLKDKGKDYYEIGTLSEEEGRDLLDILKVPTDKAANIIQTLKENLRTPQTLYKIASGAIAPEDLKGMDTLKITGKFLDRRLGRDKKLRKLCLDLVGVMGKAKDMNITEEQLSEGSPQLLAKLKDNNNHLLNVLSDLEIIQQIKTEDKSGNTSSAILLAHDTLFESLSRGIDKSTKLFKNLGIIIALVLCALWVTMMIIDPDNEHSTNLSQAVGKEQLLCDSLLTTTYFSGSQKQLSQTELRSISGGYHDIFRVYRKTTIEYDKLDRKYGSYFFIIFLAFIFFLMFYQKNIEYYVEKFDTRESRVRFFGKNEKYQLFRYRQKLSAIVIPVFIISILAVQFTGLDTRIMDKLTLFLFAAFFLFPLFILPSILVLKTIKRCRESAMVNEYFLSVTGRSMIRKEQFLSAGISMVAIIFLILLLNIPFQKYFNDPARVRLKAAVSKELSCVDVTVVDRYPVNLDLPSAEFARTRGQSLDAELDQTIGKKVSRNLVKSLSGFLPESSSVRLKNVNIAAILFYIFSSIFLVTILINMVPFELAARKYYRSS
ncbi:MAG: hypothetical protein NTU44_16145 [Bacteroidetes bacterium]|nr:hypothetical protein [Bacteroidota bacterium]